MSATVHTRLHKAKELWATERVYTTAPPGKMATYWQDAGLDLPILGGCIDQMVNAPKFSVDYELITMSREKDYHKSLLDMKRAGVMRLPYPSMVIEWFNQDVAWIVALTDYQQTPECAGELMAGWQFGGTVMRVQKDVQGDYLVVAPSWSLLGVMEQEGNPWIRMGSVNTVYIPEGTKGVVNLIEETWAKDAKAVGVGVLAAMLLMATEGIKREVIDCGRLNRKRAEHGKPPIPRHTHISIGHVYRSATGTERDNYDPRKSPRVHWRRGHLKTVRHGPGRTQVKTMFIKPRLVALPKDTIIEEPVPDYTVAR